MVSVTSLYSCHGIASSSSPCATQSSLGSDTARLVRVRAADGSEQETLASDPRCGGGSVMISDIDRSVVAVSFNYLRREWTPIDSDVAADLEVGFAAG